MAPLALLVAHVVAAPKPSVAPDWESTLDRVTKAVVSIKVNGTRAFDTESASTPVATGFVVDKVHGILLTNRHVVEPGPVVSEAVFLRNEEVPLRAIYRDPVHDFGFYAFDPKDVRYTELVELPLVPSGAKVGVDIRVVGNDSGEKLSILGGTLARLDRGAPAYGDNNYNDFNTFYFQAASNTTGGSSGSPVLDIQGQAIALNAGSRRGDSASAYYLPLDRVARALALIQKGLPVPRGTLQTVFRHQAFDEVHRLGVRPETEAAVRSSSPDETGMLVVEQVLPEGPADGRLREGDVLVTVDGAQVTGFVPLEAVLDDRVGATVRLGIERGGKPMEFELPVGDLHAITPASYLEFSGGVLNPLSYQVAHSHDLAVGGVYVAGTGNALSVAGIPSGAVIVEVDGKAVNTIEEAEAALARQADGARVPVRWFSVSNARHSQVSVLRIDRRWFPMQLCRRDDREGTWPCVASPPPPPGVPTEPQSSTYAAPPGVASKVAPTLAWVEFAIPFRVQGLSGSVYRGTGIVVDAQGGLLVCDRDTVPTTLGDLTLTFAGSLRIPGEVAYLDPEHNLAVIRYDPRLLGTTPVRAAAFDPAPLRVGDELLQVGLNPRLQVVAGATRISATFPLSLPIPRAPQYRDMNLEVMTATEGPLGSGGVLVDKRGRVRAAWLAFVNAGGSTPTESWYAVHAAVIQDAIAAIVAGKPPDDRTLGVEWAPITIATARERGLDAARSGALETAAGPARQVLSVARVPVGRPAGKMLEEGDILLSIGGRPATRFGEVEVAARTETVDLEVLRKGAVLPLRVRTHAASGASLDRAVIWAGATLHAPPPELALQQGREPLGVYVAAWWSGSPAARYGLRATWRILEVDDQPVPDLDAFLAAVGDRPDRAGVRLRCEDLDGKKIVVTLKQDLRYWPTRTFHRVGAGWEVR
jgi:S1-C subfamily serine protease